MVLQQVPKLMNGEIVARSVSDDMNGAAAGGNTIADGEWCGSG